MKAMRDIEG